MKRALFISFNDISNANSGGQQCSFRNFNMVSKLYDTDFYLVKSNHFIKIISSFLLFFPPFSIKNKITLNHKIKNNNYDIIFFDSSLFGKYSEYIKRRFKIRTISFFHNVEFDYMSVRFGNKLMKFPYLLLGWINERKALKTSTSICLCERDKNRIKSIYKITPDYIIPITFSDIYTPETKTFNINQPYILFVGALYRSNYESIKWFITEVMPNIHNVNLIIVGKDFESKRNELEKMNNIHVIGTVDNLSEYYKNAECIVSPILFGAGMKVKIAEALMHGKTIFGTDEAFQGYRTDKVKSTIVCNTGIEFSMKINEYIRGNNNKFNTDSRELYVSYYSTTAAESLFQEITNNNNL